MAITVNFIGAGLLGRALAKGLATSTAYTVQAVCNTHAASTEAAVSFIGEGKPYPTINTLPPADITFITTTDNAIAPCAEELSQNEDLKSNGIVVHCSGVFSDEILRPLKEKKCLTASIHPMRSVALPSSTDFQGAYCVMEGDNDALQSLSALFHGLGAILLPIKGTKKATYHAGGVFASNYLITLNALACQCFKEAGLSEDDAMKISIDLMQGTLNNLKETLSHQKSLTGPLKRADMDTITHHLECLDADKKQTYKSLAQHTLPLTNLNKEQLTCLSSLLNN